MVTIAAKNKIYFLKKYPTTINKTLEQIQTYLANILRAEVEKNEK